jgi:hypothetical protein
MSVLLWKCNGWRSDVEIEGVKVLLEFEKKWLGNVAQ